MNIYRWPADEKAPADGRDGGVYLILDEHGDPLYIGVCTNWTARRRGHVLREYWPLAREIVMLNWEPQAHQESLGYGHSERELSHYQDLERNEAYLIGLLKPPYNRRHVTPDSFRIAAYRSWETRRRNEAAKAAASA